MGKLNIYTYDMILTSWYLTELWMSRDIVLFNVSVGVDCK